MRARRFEGLGFGDAQSVHQAVAEVEGCADVSGGRGGAETLGRGRVVAGHAGAGGETHGAPVGALDRAGVRAPAKPTRGLGGIALDAAVALGVDLAEEFHSVRLRVIGVISDGAVALEGLGLVLRATVALAVARREVDVRERESAARGGGEPPERLLPALLDALAANGVGCAEVAHRPGVARLGSRLERVHRVRPLAAGWEGERREIFSGCRPPRVGRRRGWRENETRRRWGSLTFA